MGPSVIWNRGVMCQKVNFPHSVASSVSIDTVDDGTVKGHEIRSFNLVIIWATFLGST